MEQEIDYICHDCQQPVYKQRKDPRVYYAGHRCRTPEQIAEDERKSQEFNRTFGILEWKTGWIAVSREQKKLKD
jgi:hypothetical protein